MGNEAGDNDDGDVNYEDNMIAYKKANWRDNTDGNND